MKAAHEALLVPKEVEGRRNGVVTNESKIKAEVKNYENSIAERKKFIQKLKLDIADREKALA
jgi:GTPase involved in cell partitioning and DNA repair